MVRIVNNQAINTADTQGTTMVTGIVKEYHPERGMGFIKPSAGGRDVFLDFTVIKHLGAVLPGQRLVFDIRDHGRGPRAVNVRRPDISNEPTIGAGMTPAEHAAYVGKRMKPAATVKPRETRQPGGWALPTWVRITNEQIQSIGRAGHLAGPHGSHDWPFCP
jgi:cold shock protein